MIVNPGLRKRAVDITAICNAYNSELCMECYVLTAVLADRLRLCAWIPRSAGHGVDDPQLGVGKDDSAGRDSGTREHLPAAVTDDAGELEQELQPAHDRPQHTVTASPLSLLLWYSLPTPAVADAWIGSSLASVTLCLVLLCVCPCSKRVINTKLCTHIAHNSR